MPSYAIKSSGIRQVAANSLIGNSTGSTGSAEELSATDAKTLLGLGTTDSPTFASATIGNMTLSDAGSYDSITSGDARLALRAQDGSMELYLENASDGNDSFRFNTANGIFELFSDADNQIDLRNGTSPNSLNIFNSWTDSSNSEGFKIDWQTLPNYCLLETFATGTGVAREMRLQAAAGRFYLKASGSTYAVVTDGNGNEKYDFIDGTFSSRSTANLGSTTSRWSSLYAASTYLDNIYHSSGGGRLQLGSSGYTLYAELSCNRLIPRADATYDLGAETLAWNNIKNTGSILCYNGGASDSTNYERGAIGWDSNVFTIGTESAGTGTGRSVELIRNGVTFLELKSNSSVTVYTSLYPSSNGSLNNGFSSLRWSQYFGGGNTVTASTPMIDLAQTWNDGSVTFDAITADITDTASASDSNLLNLKAGGTSKFKVDRLGGLRNFNSNDGLGNYESGVFEFASNVLEVGSHKAGTGSSRSVDIIYGGTRAVRFSTITKFYQTVKFNSSSYNIGESPNNSSPGDIWAQEGMFAGNSSTPGRILAYNLYSDASNYERGGFDWNTTANTLTVGTEAVGTGTARDLVFGTGGTEAIKIAGSNQRITISADRTAIGSGSSHSGVLNIGGDRVMQFQGGNASIRSPSGQLDFRTSTSVFTLVGSTIRFSGYDGGGFLNIRNYTTGGTGTVVIRKLASQTSDLFKVLDDSGNNLFKIDSSGDVAIDGTTSQLLMTPTGSFGRWLKLYTSGSSPTVDAQDSLSLKADGTTAFTINHSGVDNSYIYTGDVYFNPLTSMALGQHDTAIDLLSYNTYTDASNYERGVFEWTTTSNTLTIGAEAAGTGTLRAVDFIGSAFDFNNKTITAGELQLGNTGQCKLDFAATSLYATGPEGIIFRFESDTTNASIFKFYGNSGDQLTASSGVQSFFDVDADVNQSSTAGYTGIDLDVTESATGSGDKNLMDLKVGGASKFKIDNAGGLTTTGDANISNSNTGKICVNGTTYGIKRSGSGFGFLINNEHRFVMKTDRTAISGVYSGSTPHYFGFTNTTHADTASSAVDVRLQREAANHLAMVNSTNAQTFSVAGTYTDSSNYERLKIEAGTAYNIRVQAAGTGTGRDLNIHSGASAALRLGVDGTNYIIMTSSGVKPAQDLFPNANDSYKNGTTSNRWSETNTVDLNSTGDINFSGLPTSSSGLSTGDLYLQSSGVPGGDYQIMVKA
jgi:hypothetical protein